MQKIYLSVVCSLGKTMRNKMDGIKYDTGIGECDCQQHKDFVDENHGAMF